MSLIAMALASPPAQAGQDVYCSSEGYIAPGHVCRGPNHSLRQSRAIHQAGNTSLVATGAQSSPGVMYGSWVYATDGWICHSYSGNNVLYPVAQNWSGVYSQVVQGLSYWGSEPACPPDMLPAVAARVRPLARSFAVLRRPARAVPAHIARLIGYAGLTETKARLARAVDTATGGGWVSEGDTGVCLSVPDPVDGFGVTCQGSGQVRDRGLMLMMSVPSDPDAVQVTALLPDGASATIVSDAGRTALGDNDDGLISFTARRGDRIAIQTASGSRSVSVPTATDSTAP